MGKLGKKARKFARKNLPSVMKRKRKLKSMFKKKNAPRDENDGVEDQAEDATTSSTGRRPLSETVGDASLDIFTSEDDNMVEDGSDSDGFLHEDSSCSYGAVSENEVCTEDTSQGSALSMQNQRIQSELSEKKKKLETLKQKDPNFVVFLQDRIKDRESLKNEEMSDEDEMSDHGFQPANGCFHGPATGKLLNSSTISSWCQIVKEQNELSVLPSLLNAYCAACHYGAESTNTVASISYPIIQNKESFSSLLMFMLSESDKLFRGLLGISSYCKIEAIIDLKSSSKWENLKPMIKSYLKSTLFLLNQFTETDILAYALTRLRASLLFFAAFPSLLHKLTEVAVHLWATGGGTLSSCSFLVIHDMASSFGNDYFDKCLKRTYQAIILRGRVVDQTSLKHVEYLMNSFVELCSIDMQKSVKVATASTEKLSGILQLGLQTKKKEALKKICSWEYALCIDLWVMFLSVNIKEFVLHGLLFPVIQVINGVAHLFAGQRYLPLRVKCIQWLNHLSSSSKIFIPISSLALDILEFSNAKEVGRPGKHVVNLLTTLKLPKHWLKSRDFQEECVFAAVELLSAHFLQWSHHISFPELATVPIIRMKKFHEKSTVESLRRTVKRLIDQVEKNIDFVQRKRDDVSFSPKDQVSADLFLQSEEGSGNAPYIQYYKSIMQNAMARKVITDDKFSMLEQKKCKRRKRHLPQKTKGASVNGKRKSRKISAGTSVDGEDGLKSKQKT